VDVARYGDIFYNRRTIDEIQHFIIARDLLKGYVKIGRWE